MCPEEHQISSKLCQNVVYNLFITNVPKLRYFKSFVVFDSSGAYVRAINACVSMGRGYGIQIVRNLQAISQITIHHTGKSYYQISGIFVTYGNGFKETIYRILYCILTKSSSISCSRALASLPFLPLTKT